MSLVCVRAVDGSSVELIALDETSGYKLLRARRAGVRHRARTVEFDDVPGETVVSSVPGAEDVTLEMAVHSGAGSSSMDLIDDVVDAVCSADLRTFYLEITYDTGRVETWEVTRPADLSPQDIDPDLIVSGYVGYSLTFRVQPGPTVTES